VSKSSGKCFEIALAAPTGKAAANLQKSLLSASGNDALAAISGAQTIHGLLGIRVGDSPKPPLVPLSADLIIIDESSMIDVRLMSQLFAAIKPGARLVMLGDPDQLPSVEAGNIFSDLIKTAENDTLVSRLSICLRAELQGILKFATAIKSGDVSACSAALENQGGDGSIEKLSDDLDFSELLTKYVIPFYDVKKPMEMSSEELLKYFERFRILSPFRQGPFGVEAINKQIAKLLVRDTSASVTPIMLLKNDARQQLFNGEVGVLVTKGTKGIEQGDYAIFPSRDGLTPTRKIPALLLPSFEYAFCLSVYKSQGSEFEQVLLILPEGSEVFGREVLYTAVTRARRRLMLWEKPGTLEATVERCSQRLSNITNRLKSAKDLKKNIVLEKI
jgi:exodeoxyribonuclease V alpha subunit